MLLAQGSPLALFVRTFLDSFSRTTVTDQIDVVRTELKEKTLPLYASAVDMDTGVFRGHDAIKAAWNKRAATVFDGGKRYDMKNPEFKYRPTNMVEKVHVVLDTMDNKLKLLSEYVERSFDKDIVNAQLTYLQTNLLRLAELSEFYLMFARKFLIHVVCKEFEQLQPKAGKADPLVPADVKWLEDNLDAFVQLTCTFSQSKENFLRGLKSMPDLIVSDNYDDTEAAKRQYGRALDPHELGFIPYYFNPVYHVKNLLLQWRSHRIEAAKAEREYTELRLQQLRIRREGEQNAKLDHVIEMTEQRMRKLNKKISDLQENYDKTYGIS